jgi:hypothetical protein
MEDYGNYQTYNTRTSFVAIVITVHKLYIQDETSFLIPVNDGLLRLQYMQDKNRVGKQWRSQVPENTNTKSQKASDD